MAFNISPLSGPLPVEGGLNSSQQAARARAIAALTGGDQPQPVPNASNVSAEEMGAISTPSDRNASYEPKQETSDSQESHASASQDSDSEPAEAAQPTRSEDQKRPLSAQYAQIARKEQALRAKELALKVREEALKAQEAPRPFHQPPQDDVISKAELAKDPLGVLAKLGLSYDQLSQQAMNAPTPEQIAQQQLVDELRAEIRSIKQGQDEIKTSAEKQQQKSYEQAINQIRSEVKSLVTSDPEFETIKATNSVEDVVELIQTTFNEDGILLSPEDAAKQIEDYLVEEAMKLQRISKIQKRLQTASTASPGAASQQTQGNAKAQSEAPKTLTNTLGTSRQLSARERALLAFKGELK